MPLSELFRLFKGKLHPDQEKPISSPPGGSFPMPANDFAELRFENGQVVLQGQCNHPGYKNNHALNTNSFAPPEISLNGEDDTVPFLHYPTPGSLNSSDCSKYFLSELPGLVMNESSVGNNMWSKSVAKYDHRPRPLSSNSLLGSLQSGNGLEEGTRARTSNSMRLLPSSLPLQSQTPSGNNTSAMMNSSYAPPCSTSAPQKRIFMLAAPDGKSSREPISVKKSGTVVKGDSLEEDKQSWQPSRTTKGGGSSDGEKTLEPVGGSSSVCSGNDVGGACDDMKHIFKRKYHETDSEGCSEDVEEESVSAKRQAAGPDIPRRTRAAEVHSQSERRRRDRINEKMRTLKELIPNCNKVDKASMLDEVIEYIKTLKLQLQMVTMGAGTCMMPTILSTVMQHVGHVPYFPTNMGMSMIPAMHAMVSPMYDLPGQGFALPMPCTPLVPFSGAVIELPKGPNNACGVLMHAENQDLSMVSNGINSVRGNGKHSVQNTACLTEKRQNSQCAGATSTGKVSDKMCTSEITDCISGEDHPKTLGM